MNLQINIRTSLSNQLLNNVMGIVIDGFPVPKGHLEGHKGPSSTNKSFGNMWLVVILQYSYNYETV